MYLFFVIHLIFNRGYVHKYFVNLVTDYKRILVPIYELLQSMTIIIRVEVSQGLYLGDLEVEGRNVRFYSLYENLFIKTDPRHRV